MHKHTRYHLLVVEKSDFKKTIQYKRKIQSIKALVLFFIKQALLSPMSLLCMSCNETWYWVETKPVPMWLVYVFCRNIGVEKSCALCRKKKYHGMTENIKESKHVYWLPECTASVKISKYKQKHIYLRGAECPECDEQKKSALVCLFLHVHLPLDILKFINIYWNLKKKFHPYWYAIRHVSPSVLVCPLTSFCFHSAFFLCSRHCVFVCDCSAVSVLSVGTQKVCFFLFKCEILPQIQTRR